MTADVRRARQCRHGMPTGRALGRRSYLAAGFFLTFTTRNNLRDLYHLTLRALDLWVTSRRLTHVCHGTSFSTALSTKSLYANRHCYHSTSSRDKIATGVAFLSTKRSISSKTSWSCSLSLTSLALLPPSRLSGLLSRGWNPHSLSC